MGFYPCSGHGLMFKGPAQAMYPALIEGGNSERSHLRFCKDCFADVIAQAEKVLTEVIAGAKPESANQRVCYLCQAEGARFALFVTAYPKGEEPRQFFGAVCADDLGAARAAWVEPGSPV